MPFRSTRRILLTVASAALIAAACNGSEARSSASSDAKRTTSTSVASTSVAPTSTTAAPTSTTIETAVGRAFAAEVDVSADGTASVHELIEVELPAGKHGIIRAFDEPGADPPVQDLEVAVDEQPAPWE